MLLLGLLVWSARAEESEGSEALPEEDAPEEDAPEEDAPEEGAPARDPALRSFTLTPDGQLESALQGFDEAVEDTEAMPEELLEEISGPLALAADAAALMEKMPAGLVSMRMRGRFFLRPTLSVGGLGGAMSTRLGIAGGHRWWGVSPTRLTLAGETRLAADVPLAGARGRALSISTLAGPWLGPVGLRLGGALTSERADYGTAVLDSALTAGPRGVLSLQLDGISPYLGGGVEWLLSGDRPGEREPVVLAGLGWQDGWVRLVGQGSLRQTAQGRRWEAGLGLQITPRLPGAESEEE